MQPQVNQHLSHLQPQLHHHLFYSQVLPLILNDTKLNLFLQIYYRLLVFTAISDVDTESSQRSSLSSNSATGVLFSRLSSRVSTLTSDSQLINIDLDFCQYSSPTTANGVDYPRIVNDILVQRPRQDPCFRFFATHKNTSNTSVSDSRRNTELQRLDANSLQLKFEVTVDFENINTLYQTSPHPIPNHTQVKFKRTPHPFITNH